MERDNHQRFTAHVETRERASDDSDVITGYASTFGNVYHAPDSSGTGTIRERIEAGAFKGNLTGRVPVFWSHTFMEKAPIGEARAWEDDRGLRFRAELYTSISEDAQRVYKAAQAGAIDEVSMGFTSSRTERERDDNGRTVYVVKRANLHEISFVLRASNPQAKVQAVRARSAYRRSTDAAREQVRKAVARAAKREPSGSKRDAFLTLYERSRDFRELCRRADL